MPAQRVRAIRSGRGGGPRSNRRVTTVAMRFIRIPRVLRIAVRSTWAACAIVIVGCASQPANPSFPTRVDSAQKDLGRMESQPRELRRPLLVVGGILDPGIASGWLKWE